MADLDDGFALCSPRGVSVQAYAQRLVDAGTALAAEGRSQARVMVFTLRPFLSGQPFRATAILNALVRLQATPGVWLATPQDIVNAWLQAEASGASEPSVAGSPARPASAEELSTKATP